MHRWSARTMPGSLTARPHPAWSILRHGRLPCSVGVASRLMLGHASRCCCAARPAARSVRPPPPPPPHAPRGRTHEVVEQRLLLVGGGRDALPHLGPLGRRARQLPPRPEHVLQRALQRLDLRRARDLLPAALRGRRGRQVSRGAGASTAVRTGVESSQHTELQQPRRRSTCRASGDCAEVLLRTAVI